MSVRSLRASQPPAPNLVVVPALGWFWVDQQYMVLAGEKLAWSIPMLLAPLSPPPPNRAGVLWMVRGGGSRWERGEWHLGRVPSGG